MFHADPVPNGLAAPFRKLMASATLQGRSGCRSHHQHLGGSGRLRRQFAVFFSASPICGSLVLEFGPLYIYIL